MDINEQKYRVSDGEYLRDILTSPVRWRPRWKTSEPRMACSPLSSD